MGESALVFADAAASMSYRGVATMAFMLAMAANIGIETMISSFRDTTDKWLNQRLAADVYVYPHNNVASRMSVWLKAQPEVNAVWWRWERKRYKLLKALSRLSVPETRTLNWIL